MSQSFDVVVIGGGPGGYVAAIRAAQLGLKTACIDDWKTPDGKPALGGTCTNIGCIPSKALLQSSENFEQAGHGFAEHGVRVKGLELDLAQMLKRKDQVVKASNDGVVYLFKKNKVAFFHGRGSFTKAGTDGCEIVVKGAQNETVTAKNVIVASSKSRVTVRSRMSGVGPPGSPSASAITPRPASPPSATVWRGSPDRIITSTGRR